MTVLQEIANSLRLGYVFYKVDSGQAWLPEQIEFRFVYKNREEFIKIISQFVDLQQSTEEIRNQISYTVGSPTAMTEFKDFLEPTVIKGFENDSSIITLNTGIGFFSIFIIGVKPNSFGIQSPINLETAMKLEKLIEEKDLQNFISHQISKFSNCVKKNKV